MRILGVDPGGTGALALLSQNGLHLDVRDMPVLTVSRGKGTKKVVDVHQLASWVSELKPDICYFEQVQGMDGDGASASFNFGRIAGATEAVVKLSGARFIFIAPGKWKRTMGLIRKQKDDSRAKAINLWPRHHDYFKLKKHDGRAEAALIAEYGRLQEDRGVFS